MLKKVFLAAVASVILAGATVTMSPAPAQAFNGCHKAAKAAYPHDKKARKAYKKACKAHHKHHHHHHLFGK